MKINQNNKSSRSNSSNQIPESIQNTKYIEEYIREQKN